jgi:RNA polymerase sigma factor (sigma-70 family)
MDESQIRDSIRKAAAGDHDSAARLARHYEGSLRGIIRPRLGAELRSRVDSDDIFQSAIMAAINSLSGLEYHGERAMVGWLTVIADRKIRSAARHHRAHRRDFRRELPLDDARGVEGGGTSPTKGAARGELVEGIHRAVGKLPEPYRAVVRLHSFEGLGFSEVARIVGLRDKSAARRAFQRALRMMGDPLGGDRAPGA